MSYPREQPQSKDLLDIILQSAQTVKEVQQIDGSVKNEAVVDPEIVWWKTLMVGSNTLGRFAFELKEFERMAFEAFNNMSRDRAKDFAHTVIDIGSSYRRSLDAKSSESVGINKENSISTLVDKINKSQVEKIYTAKGKVSNNFLNDLLHRDQNADEQR